MNKYIQNLIKKIWANIYFSNDKFDEYSTKISDFIYDLDSEYFSQNINDLCDELFGEGLYRFSSRLLIRETKQVYNRYNWDSEHVLYHNKKNDNLTIRLSYFIPIKQAIKIGRIFINKFYKILIEDINNTYGKGENKNINLYKFQSWGDNDVTHEYDEDFIKYINSPCIIIDLLKPKINQIINIFNFYTSNESELYCNTDMYSIYQYNLKNNILFNKYLNEYTNKITFENLLNFLLVEIISTNNTKTCVFVEDYITNEMKSNLSDIPLFLAPFLYKTMINDSNHKLCIYDYNLSTTEITESMKMYNRLFDISKEFNNKINDLKYDNCESLEDLFVELKYYLCEEYCINILPIHLNDSLDEKENN